MTSQAEQSLRSVGCSEWLARRLSEWLRGRLDFGACLRIICGRQKGKCKTRRGLVSVIDAKSGADLRAVLMIEHDGTWRECRDGHEIRRFHAGR